MVIDEIIIEKKESDLNEIQLEIKENKLITELTNLEIAPKATEQIFKSSKGTAFNEVKINGDKNLISKNIKKDTAIFGVAGDNNVVDTSDAQLSTSYLHPNYSGYAKGKKYQGEAALINSKTPMKLAGVSTIVNSEYPYFVLTHQWEAGQIKGEIVKINSEAIDTQAFTDKNICIRANYNPEVFGEKAWNVEIAVCDWGYKFRFKSSSGYWCIICKDDITNESKPYTLYHQQVKELTDLTVDNWSQRDVQPSNYMDQSIGKSGIFYCYSRDNSSPSTGLGSSKGVEGNYGKILVKNNVINGFTKGFLDSEPELYNLVEQNTLAEAINLKAEDIKEGAIYLGVNGTAPDNDAKIDATGLTTFTVAGALKSIDKMTVPETCTNFSKGFQNCANLTSIPDLSHIPLTNVTYMFDGCSNLENPPALNTSQATSGDYMFRNCKKMKNAPQIDTSRMASYNYMYNGCSSLENIPNHNWSGARNIQYVFQNCTSLKNVDFKTTYGSCMAYSLFSGCTSLETAKLSISPYNMSSIFANCTSLESVELHNGSGGTFYSENAQNTFQNCTNLKTIVSPLNLAVPNGSGASNSYFSYLFDGCTSLEDTSNLNFSRGTYGPGWSCDYMFRNCTSLKNLPASLEAMTGPFCSQMRYVFQGCTGLEKVNHLALSYLCSNIFYGCSNLTTANITFTTGSSGQTQNVFTNCSSLKNVTGTMTSSNNHADLSNWFQNCTAMETTPDIFETYTGTAALKNTFWGCTSLKTVRQGWANIVGNIIKNCFNGCINLVTVPEFDGSKINSAQKEYWEFAFTGCDSLSDESLNNIMASMTKYKGTMNTRTMSQLGFNTNQIERCKNLSNYQAFINAGWQAK